MASPDISTSRTDTLWLNQMLDCIIYSARTDIGRFFATSLDDLMPISKLTNADDYRRYPIFAPDDIVHRISGLIPPAKDAGTDTLEAFGDGSFFGYRYKVLEQHGVTAVGGYGTFMQAGYYTAEYGFGMLDSKHVLDISGFEFLAAIVAMKVAIDGGYKKLIIHHDSRIVNPEVFNSFYKQIALNTGLGFRYDFGFVLLRLDWGLKLHNPNVPKAERWTSGFDIKETALHFAIGLPF